MSETWSNFVNLVSSRYCIVWPFITSWFHQGVWTPAHRLDDGPRPTPNWILLAGCTDVRWHVRQRGRRAIQRGSSLVEPRTARSAATVIRRVTRYKLRQRPHSLQLPEHTTQLSDCNFLIRLLYKNTYMYWLLFLCMFSHWCWPALCHAY